MGKKSLVQFSFSTQDSKQGEKRRLASSIFQSFRDGVSVVAELLQLVSVPVMVVAWILDVVNHHCDQSLIGWCERVQASLLLL